MDDEDNDQYMKAPEANSLRGLIEALGILAASLPNGLDEKYTLDAEHDVFWCSGDVDRKSDAGRRLIALGWHWDDDVERWAYFT